MKQNNVTEPHAKAPKNLSSLQIVHDTGKGAQLFCEPIALAAGASSACLCSLIVCMCMVGETPARSMVSHEERAQIYKEWYGNDIKNAGVCGAGIIRGSAYLMGNLYGVFRAGTQSCYGQIKSTDKVFGYSQEQIKAAPGICDGIPPLEDEENRVVQQQPMNRY